MRKGITLGYYSFVLTMILEMLTAQPHALEFVSLDDECRNCSDRCSAAYGPSYLVNDKIYAEKLTSVDDEGRSPKLKMDTASLTVVSKCSHSLVVQIRSSECYQCSFTNLALLTPKSEAEVSLDTVYGSELQVVVQTIPKPQIVCSDSTKFTQYGNYTYHISPNTTVDVETKGYICVISSADPPEDANIPVYVLIGAIVIVAISWTLVSFINRRYSLYSRLCLRTHRIVNNDFGMPHSRSTSTPNLNSELGPNQGGDPESPRAGPIKFRLVSLDTFRGISVTLMIFVNYGGGKYWYFKHAAWNGLHVADLVFPWFIFIMGTSMVFSFDSQVSRNTPWQSILLKIVKRSIILILIGLVLNSAPGCPEKVLRLHNLRIPGVLQRIGVTYLITASIHLAFVYKQERSRLYDVAEWVVQLVLLSVYLMLTFLLPVPGCPTGYLGPGGRAEYGKYENCTGGAAGYIDRMVFGTNHIYKHPTCHRVYGGSVAYDPEGLLGCLTSVFLCFLGIQAGKLFHHPCWKRTTVKLLACCVIASCFGFLLCQARKEGGWIPINKNLWSPSFILCIAGTSYLLLAVCYVLVDQFKVWSGSPFSFVGMNPFLMYICHEVFHFYLPVNFHVPENHWSQLALDCWGTVFWLIVAYILHRKKIYLSI